MQGYNQSASPVGNKVGNAISGSASILYSLMGDVPICGQYIASTDVLFALSINLLIQSTSLDSLNKRGKKGDR